MLRRVAIASMVLFLLAMVMATCFLWVQTQELNTKLTKIDEDAKSELAGFRVQTQELSEQLAKSKEGAKDELEKLRKNLNESVDSLRAEQKNRVAELETRVPLGMMLPFFGKDLPQGFVWADGQTDWPDKDWVPMHLRKTKDGKQEKVPNMDSYLIGGTTSEDQVGTVWNEGVIKGEPIETRKKGNNAVVVNPAFSDRSVMGLINPNKMDEPYTHAPLTYVNLHESVGDKDGRLELPVIPLNSAVTNPRHVVCRWIIRIE